MQSILIIGGNLAKRREKAITELSNYQIANLDTLIVEGKNSIGIDKVRELEKWAFRKPHSGRYKAALIFEAEKLTHTAQNALLKTLEEPPKNTLIILTSPKEDLLLPTIVSRCKIIKLKSETEISLSKKKITQLLNYLISLLNCGVGERIKKAEDLINTKEETTLFLDQLIFLLRELLLSKLSKLSLSSHLPCRLRQSRAVVYLGDKLPMGTLTQIIRNAQKTKGVIEKNINPRLALENFFLDLPLSKC